MGVIDRAWFFITKNKVRQFPNTHNKQMFEVGNHTVIIHQKAGRKIITCSCKSHSLFPREPTICSHKIAAIVRWFFGDKFKNIINLILTWKTNE